MQPIYFLFNIDFKSTNSIFGIQGEKSTVFFFFCYCHHTYQQNTEQITECVCVRVFDLDSICKFSGTHSTVEINRVRCLNIMDFQAMFMRE